MGQLGSHFACKKYIFNILLRIYTNFFHQEQHQAELLVVQNENRDELKANNDILNGEIDILKRKLENGTQLMIDHQNGIQNLDKMIRKEIQILKVLFAKSLE